MSCCGKYVARKRANADVEFDEIPSGVEALPGLAFESDPDTGIYRVGANSIGISTGGTKRLQIDTSNVTSTLPVIAPTNVSAGVPGYTFSGDTNTGLYSAAADTVGLVTGGTSRLQASTSTVTVQNANLDLNSNDIDNVDDITMNNATSVLSLSNAGALITHAGTTAATSTSTGALTVAGGVGIGGNIHTGGAVAAALGSAGTVAYGFASDPNTGMYSSGADTLNLSTGGSSRLQINSTNATSTVPFAAPLGSAGTVAYGFSGDPNTGMFSPAADQLNLVVGAASKLTLTSTTVTVAGAVLDMNTNDISNVDDITMNNANSVLSLSNAGALITHSGTTASTNSSTGALTVAGGVGIGGALNTAGNIGGSASLSLTGASSALNLTQSGSTLVHSGTTASTSGSTGALTVAGGVGVGGNIGVTGTILASDGTAAVPSRSYVSDTDTGFYRPTANTLGFATNGISNGTLASTGLSITDYSANADESSFTDSGIVEAYTYRIMNPRASQTGNTSLSTTTGSPSIVSSVTDVEGKTLSSVFYTGSTLPASYSSSSLHATTAAIFTAGTYSIAFWLNPAVLSGSLGGIFTIAAGSTGVDCFRDNTFANTMNWRVLVAGVASIHFRETTVQPVNTWVHYAVTFDAAGNIFYRDGIAIVSGSGRTNMTGTTATAAPTFTPTSITIGQSSALGSSVEQYIKNFVVSSTIWTAAQVRALRNQGLAKPVVRASGRLSAYGGVRYVITTPARALYYATHEDQYLNCTATVTDVYLPDQASAGQLLTIMNTTGGNITVRAQGSDVLSAADGTTYTLATKNGITCYSAGTGRWYLTASI